MCEKYIATNLKKNFIKNVDMKKHVTTSRDSFSILLTTSSFQSKLKIMIPGSLYFIETLNYKFKYYSILNFEHYDK